MQTKLSYAASATGVVFGGLTINEVVGVFVGLSSVALACFTTWSNHKKNKAIIANLDDKEAQLMVDEARG